MVIQVRTPQLSEILNEIDSEKSRNKKKELLLKHKKNRTFIFILWYAYNPNLKCVLDKSEIQDVLNEGKVPDPRNMDERDSPANVYTEHRSLKSFFFVNKQNSEKFKKLLMQKLSGYMEMMHEDEFFIIKSILFRDNLARGLTEKLVREVFPNLLPKNLGE